MAVQMNIGAAADRVVAKLVAGLEVEFGRGAGTALAARFLEAEESDFVWDARVCERWLGTFENDAWAMDADGSEPEIELDRVAVLGRLDGRWFVAVSIVDGDGQAQGLMARRGCASERSARIAFAALR
jgi:hypothetical protein